MVRKLGLPLLILALALVFWWMDPTQGKDPSSSGSSAAGSDSKSPSIAEGSADGRAQGSRRMSLEAPVPNPSDSNSVSPMETGFHGWVWNRAGRPCPGALVYCLEEDLEQSVGTDGRFSLPLAELPARNRPRTIWAWAPGYSFQLLRANQVRPLHFQLRSDPGFLVRVEDQLGRPLSGAQVELFAESGMGLDQRRHRLPYPPLESDGAGEIRLPFGDPVLARFQAPGKEPAWLQTKPAPAKRNQAQVVRLFPESDRNLQLVDRLDQPLSQALLRLSPSQWQGRADAEGRLQLSLGLLRTTRQAVVQQQQAFWVLQPGWDDGLDWPPPEGGRLAFKHFPREGQLLGLDGEDDGGGSRFEIATTAVRESLGLEFHPDPSAPNSALIWQTVAEDGSFHLQQGWQGPRTALLVRRKTDRALLLQKEVRGPGPYRLEIPSHFKLTLEVSAEPQDLFQGATVWFERESASFASSLPVPPAVLSESLQTEIFLRPGNYQVSLQTSEHGQTRPLGRLRMPSKDHHWSVDLGSLRDASGVIRLGGEPVFPCEILLQEARGPWRGSTWTDAEGNWFLPAIPAKKLQLRVQPSDPWLQEPVVTVREFPASQDHLILDLPFAVLHLSQAASTNFSQYRHRLWGQRLPYSSGEAEHSRRVRGLNLALPDLPATIRTSPCRLLMGSLDHQLLVEPKEVSLADGEILSVPLHVQALGLVVLRVRGKEGLFQASVTWRWLGEETVPSPQTAHGRGLQYPEGALTPAYALAPGLWHLQINGPIRSVGPITQPSLAGAGQSRQLELEVTETGLTTVWVEFEEEGKPDSWKLVAGSD
ncbi:MAG: hypothetical protein DWQ01_03450 [Planctomycetota bacterium]|nr:MAG: hypothetical protein DWQ01_03450 [Planctomycetota bacterium]